MSRIEKLFKNLRYISKLELKKNRLLESSTEELMANILYYIPTSSVVRPNVFDGDQTTDVLCKTNKSLARFGDAELVTIGGGDTPFQKYDERLATRLREILQNNNDKLMIGINHWYYFPTLDPNQNELAKNFALFAMPKYRKQLNTLIDFKKQYFDAAFTCIRYEKSKNNDDFFNKIRSVWDSKEVVLVGCHEAQKKYQYNLFDNASKETWVYVPNTNAFSEYDNLLNTLCLYPKDSIIILMAGSTAKVLANDLSLMGYRALDLGHIAKSYDYYMRSVVFNSEIEEDFWKPDL